MTSVPEKMSGTSLDIASDKRARLKQLFPTVFTETMNDKGAVVESMDFEQLKAELGTFTDLFENRRERYGMDWPGKKEALKLIQTPSAATLKPCREESVNFDTTENLFVEGDNLEVLKLLQKSYYGKVKMIFIDPPYNTGNEFIYPDNFSETLETYLEYVGLVDGEGKKFSTNTANEGRFHTKWLNMMYPRLYLARNLLREDGAIFISIDDNEVTNLRSICDHIFGQENFVATIAWQKVFAKKNKALISGSHDHILLYVKHIENWKRNLIPRTEEQLGAFQNPDNDPRGDWQSVSFSVQSEGAEKRAEYRYPIKLPSGRAVMPPTGRHWNGLPERFKELDDDKRIWYSKNGDSPPRIKAFLSEVQSGIVPDTWWNHEDAGNNQEAKKEIIELFGEEDEPFSTPKPTRLILRMLQIATSPQGADIVLDFFAGSGTTAHAVLKANVEDNGNRRFILVQLPEKTKSGKYSTIADICRERISKVIKKIVNDRKDNLKEIANKLPGIMKEQSSIDLGFRVLKLDKSNFKQWQSLPPDTAPEKLVEQLNLFINHIDPKASPEDLLYEILIKAGFPPSEPIATQTLAGKTVYAIAGGGLLLCLENEISTELINAVSEAEPMQFICLDAAFGGNDQLKANAVQTFAARNLGKEKHNQIVFKTV